MYPAEPRNAALAQKGLKLGFCDCLPSSGKNLGRYVNVRGKALYN